MEKTMEELLKKIGSWLFLLGILISVVVGIVFAANPAWLANYSATISTILAVLGFIVGVLSFFALGSITKERVPTFLIAALMLVGIGAALNTNFFSQINYIGAYFTNIAAMIAVFVAPAAGILAIRAIWDAGKTEEIEKVMPKIPK
jgi:cation transport ATPase